MSLSIEEHKLLDHTYQREILREEVDDADDVRPRGPLGRDELLRRLHYFHSKLSYEVGHLEAERVLLAYINDPEISEAFNAVPRGYE